MIRVRFRTTATDHRPFNWPVKHPYWVTGYSGDDFDATIISYADDMAYIIINWPEGTDFEVEEVDGYTFTDRFPKPEWFTEDGGLLHYDVLGKGRDVLLPWLTRYEIGLDTAGASEQMLFEDWIHDLNAGETTVDVLFTVIAALIGTNGDMVTELLQEFIEELNNEHDMVRSFVAQTCTIMTRCERPILSSYGMSTYAAGLQYMETRGKVVRLPGPVERYVWAQHAVSTKRYEEDWDVEICDDCLELAGGPHAPRCPNYEKEGVE